MRRIVLPALIIMILFLVGCTSTVTTSEIGDKSGNDVLNDCFSKIDETPGESYVQYQQDVCRLEIAKESKNQKLCSEIKNENKKSECDSYFKELPFVEGSATKEDILEKCKCTSYCYGTKYYIKCINENVITPQQCQSLMGLHWDTYAIEGTKRYFEEAELKTCLRSLIDRQDDLSFCEEYPELYSEVCEDIKQEEIEAEKFELSLSTRHIMTDDKDVWVRAPNQLDEALEIIEAWKVEGYENFRIIECDWDEEFEVCIDVNTVHSEGDVSGLECNRHIVRDEVKAKFHDVLSSKFC